VANIILISYDNGSHIPFFPMNLYYLTGALVQEGHDVKILYQDLQHFPDSAITRMLDYEFKSGKADIVGLGFVAGYYQYAKAKSISEAVNRSERRKDFRYILGGHGPAADPDYFLRKFNADTVVVGDGEQGVIQLAAGSKERVIHSLPCESDTSPIGIYPQFPIDIYRLIRWPTSTRTDFCFPILSSRGCKWSCTFCYRMRDGFHERAVEAIVDEIRYLHKKFTITHFQFADELLMSSEKRTTEICESLLRLPFRIKWDCNGRLNWAKKPILTLMKRSGASYINYGIESLNQQILNKMNKGLTPGQITEGVVNTVSAGLSPGLNLLWGFPGDTFENLDMAVEFIEKHDPCDELRTIRPVTPYPGTPLFKEAVELGLVKDTEDFYENKHKNSDLITINFMDIPTEEAHKALWRANYRLVQNYFLTRHSEVKDKMYQLYYKGDTSFRGYRAV
jgi:anaerobic magnesium-protoporphyrin IX monomethyl ester cyclase